MTLWRFPRAAYVRRVNRLTRNLSAFHARYHEMATGQNSHGCTQEQLDLADQRAWVLELLIKSLVSIERQLEAMR